MTRTLLPLFFAAGLLLLPFPLRAEARDGNARALLDAYLAQAALEVPAYRADLQAGGGPGRIPPGRLSGVAPLLGPFTYRSRTFGELTRAQRTALLLDPKWRAFLIVTTEQKHRAGPASIPPSHPPQIGRFSVAPAEMLKPGPLLVALPPP